MDSDALRPVLSRYNEAFDAYRECAKRNAQHSESGTPPTEEEIAAEANAMEALAAARRGLFDAIAVLSGSGE